jgi:hypothetical protein
MEARRLPAYLPKTAKNNLYLEILEALKGWLTVKSNPEISEALKRRPLNVYSPLARWFQYDFP